MKRANWFRNPPESSNFLPHPGPVHWRSTVARPCSWSVATGARKPSEDGGATETNPSVSFPTRSLPIIALSLLPILAVLALVDRYAVNVPYQDEWDWSVLHVVQGDLPQLRLDRFWALGNEHRVFVPTLLTAALGHATNLNMIAPLYLKVALTAVSLWFLSTIYRRSTDHRHGAWVTVVFSALLFSVAQWPRWVDVRPIPSTLSIVGLTGALLCTTTGRPSTKRFVLAVVLAILSSLSYFSGNVTWIVVGCAMALTGWTRRHLVAWTILALAVLIPYGIDLAASPSPTSTETPASVSEMVEFLFVFVGSLLSWGSRGSPQQGLAILFGILGLASTAILAVWLAKDTRSGLRKAVPWIAIAGWVVINGCAAAYGRAAIDGAAYARVARYTVFGAQFWIALSGLACLALFEPTSSRRLRIAGCAAAGLLGTGLVGSSTVMLNRHVLDELPQLLRTGREALLLDEEAPDEKLELLYPGADAIRQLLPELIERRASFLHGVRRLELADAQIDHPEFVQRSRTRFWGEMATVIEGPAPFTASWTTVVHETPVADLRVGWAVLPSSTPATLTVRVRDDKETVELAVEPSTLDGSITPLVIDLHRFRGRRVELILSVEGSAMARLVGPALVYSVAERE